MPEVAISELRSRIFDEVKSGAEYTVTRQGRPVARLVPPHHQEVTWKVDAAGIHVSQDGKRLHTLPDTGAIYD